jgi:hypothetical protein
MKDLKKIGDGKRAGATRITYERSSDGSVLELDPTKGETRQSKHEGNGTTLPPI